MPDLKISIFTDAKGDGASIVSKQLKSAAESARFLATTLKQVEQQAAQTNASLTGGPGGKPKSAAQSAAAMMGAKGAADARDMAGALSGMTREAKAAGTATEELEKKTAKSIGSKVALKNAVRQLSHEYPVLNMAMRALMSPWTAIIALAAAAVYQITKQIKVFDEQAKAANELAHSLDPLIVNQKRSAQLHAESLVTMQAHTLALNTNRTALELNTAAANANAEARERIHTANAAIRAAEAELAAAKGGGDPHIQAALANDAKKREEDAIELRDRTAIDTAHRKLRDAKGNEAGLQLPGALAALEAAKTTQGEKSDKAKALLHANEVAQKAAEETLQAEKLKRAGMGQGPLWSKRRLESDAKIQAAEQAIAGAKASTDTITGGIATAGMAVTTAQDRVNKLSAEDKAAKESVPGLQDAYNKTILDAESRVKTHAAVQGIRAQTADVNYTQRLIGRVQSELAAGTIQPDVINPGMTLSKEQKQAMQHYDAMMSSGAVTFATISRGLKWLREEFEKIERDQR